MTFSVCIPTLDEVEPRLIESLMHQTDSDFETLIATDGEPAAINWFLPSGRKIRWFSTQRLYDGSVDSLVPDNVLFREAKGDILIHLDSDGYIDHRLIEFLRTFYEHDSQSMLYGQIWFVEPDTLEVIQKDFPCRAPKNDAVMHRIMPDFAAGAIWSCPTHLLREIGGHDMQFVGKRGCDARLGWRLGGRGVTQYLVSDPAMRFYHLGITQAMQHEKDGDAQWKYDTHAHPTYTGHHHPIIANGGSEFWNPENFPIKYREII